MCLFMFLEMNVPPKSCLTLPAFLACPRVLLSLFFLACPRHTSFPTAPWTSQGPSLQAFRPGMIFQMPHGWFSYSGLVQLSPSCWRVQLVPTLLLLYSTSLFMFNPFSSLSPQHLLIHCAADLLGQCSGFFSTSQALLDQSSVSWLWQCQGCSGHSGRSSSFLVEDSIKGPLFLFHNISLALSIRPCRGLAICRDSGI